MIEAGIAGTSWTSLSRTHRTFAYDEPRYDFLVAMPTLTHDEPPLEISDGAAGR